jgi:hypothetical protein
MVRTAAMLGKGARIAALKERRRAASNRTKSVHVFVFPDQCLFCVRAAKDGLRLTRATGRNEWDEVSANAASDPRHGSARRETPGQ